MAHYSVKKILRHNADINIIYGTRSNGKSFSVLQNAVIDYMQGVGGFGYVRRRTAEITKSKVDKYFRDPNFQKWMEEYTDGTYNTIFYRAGDLFIAKKENGEVIKESVALFGSAFSLQNVEENKSLHYEFIYNILIEEGLTRQKYLEEEPTLVMSLLSTIQRNGRARLWFVGNTVSRVCPYFPEWGLANFRNQKVGTIADYKKVVDNGDGTTRDVFISVEYAENTADHNNSLAFGRAAKAVTGNEWESDAHPHLFFRLEDAEILYTCYYEYMNFCFKLQILFYGDAPYLYIYPYTRQEVRAARGRELFTQEFETVSGRWNKACKPQHDLIRKLLATNKAVYSDDLCGDEFSQCLKSFNPFRYLS